MSLPFVIDDLTKIPEPFRGEYESRDGKHHLKTEGDIPAVTETNAKLAEFRDNNIALMKKADELAASLKSFEGIDPAEHKKLKSQVAALEEHGTSRTKLETDLESRVKDAETKLADMELSKKEAESNLARRNIEANLTKVALKAGVEEKAMTDYIHRGLGVFNLEGKAMKGDTPLYSTKSPTEGLSMEEWTASLMQDAPHLFKQSKGGGTRHGEGGNANARIIGADPVEFGRNLEGIAKGEVVVNKEF